MSHESDATRVCPYDAMPLTKMWEFVGGTEVKHDSGSYLHTLFVSDSARGYPYVCSRCGLLLYFLDHDGLARLFPAS